MAVEMLKNGNAKFWVYQIILSVLLIMISVISTSSYQIASMKQEYVTRAEYSMMLNTLQEFRINNREDHKEIRAALVEILKEIGRKERAGAYNVER